MVARLKNFWNAIQGSLWFLPSTVVVGCVALAFIMVWLDHSVREEVASLPLLFQAGPEAARDTLSTISTSMLTVASVAFSFTIVVFSFASSQYGSRTLHNFMDDNVNQTVLGTLLGTFVYCQLVLRTIRLEENSFVPSISVNFALLLATADLGLFIFYIHHVSETIQAYHIIHRVGAGTRKSIESIFHARASSAVHHIEDEDLYRLIGPQADICSSKVGYIQAIDTDSILALMQRHDLFIEYTKAVGMYVVQGERLARVGPTSRVTRAILAQVQKSFLLGAHRTLYQDPQYGVLMLADIAIKALSPAINDPNTAVMSLNQISSVLRLVAARELPEQVRYGVDGKVRAILNEPTFEKLAAQAFDQVRRFGTTDATIPIKLLDVIEEIAAEDTLPAHLEVLRLHTRAIIEDAELNLKSTRDKALFSQKVAALPSTLVSANEYTLLEVP
ncbi:MAG TPA: DUF2254 domain-containing protein [Chloroflexia bacterium]|jgi:uncharacterized membrane protein